VFIENRLPAGDGAISKEENPNPVPPIPILGDDPLLVAHPVLVPAIDCSRVVDTKNVNVLDLKASTFQLFLGKISNFFPSNEKKGSDKPC